MVRSAKGETTLLTKAASAGMLGNLKLMGVIYFSLIFLCRLLKVCVTRGMAPFALSAKQYLLKSV